MACRNKWFGLVMIVVGIARAGDDAAAQRRGYEPEDYYRLTNVSEVAVSPAGDWVAFTVTTVVESENRRHREVWLQPLADGRPDGDAFRATGPTEESSDPRWSPDGSLLAFSSSRGDDPNSVWFLRVVGLGGEAFHIEGVEGAPVWSPDGSRIAYVKATDDQGDFSDDARKGWVSPDAVSRTLDATRFDGRVVTSIRYKRDGRLAFQPHYSVRPKRQIMVTRADGGMPQPLTRLDFDAGSPVWSPDGETIFFTGDERQDEELRTENSGAIWAVSARGGTVRRLTTNPGTETAPAVSPDGGRVAFLSTPARGAQTDVLVAETGPDGSFRGEPVNVTADWDLRPGAPRWSPDGRAVLFSAGVRGERGLYTKVTRVEPPVNLRGVDTGLAVAYDFRASNPISLLTWRT